MALHPVRLSRKLRQGLTRQAAEEEAVMFMAFHSTKERKPFIMGAALSLLLLGFGVGLAFA